MRSKISYLVEHLAADLLVYEVQTLDRSKAVAPQDQMNQRVLVLVYLALWTLEDFVGQYVAGDTEQMVDIAGGIQGSSQRFTRMPSYLSYDQQMLYSLRRLHSSIH